MTSLKLAAQIHDHQAGNAQAEDCLDAEFAHVHWRWGEVENIRKHLFLPL